jgi:hypothetical protein
VSRARYVVTVGERPGELVLTPVTDPKALAPDALVVSLVAHRDADVPRLARALMKSS